MNTTIKQASLRFRIIVSMALVIYICACIVWMLPESRFRNALYDILKVPMLYTGIWQNFAVFSPNPRLNNMYLSAVVTFEDGSTQYFEFPRNDKLALWQRPQKERFRKFGLDNLYYDQHRVLWPDAARYVARQVREKAPVLVALQRHWQDLPPPERGLGNPLPDEYGLHTFFVYRVKPEDLR